MAEREPNPPYDCNVATIPPPSERGQNARQQDSEMVTAWSAVCVKDGLPVEVVTARWWMGRSRNASTQTCSLWVRCADGEWATGKGRARGYGYCRMSAAFDEAVTSAGIKLARNVHGTGESTVRIAMAAIAAAAGYEGCPLLIVEHG